MLIADFDLRSPGNTYLKSDRALNATAMNAKAQPYLDFRMWWP